MWRYLAACTGLLATVAAEAASDEVAVVRAAPWSPGDSVREGAGEFEVLMSVARLQREHHSAAVIAVGGRHGLFTAGAERALRFVALRGVPVARLASGGELALDPDALFLDCGHLSESDAAAVIERCLNRLGSPPMAADPDHPTSHELAAIRAYLAPFRKAILIASGPRLTVR
jgi:hypothetical protein